jgi:flagellin
MTNDVVLSAALRNNLLSLQDTQNSINTHQNRLATGKKVNSALDNPQSFFAAQALTNAASDLSGLLDSVGQSIQVINAANNGVTALTSLISQAQSIANSAQSALAGASTTATVSGATTLSSSTLLNSITGLAASGDVIGITVTDPTTGLKVLDGTVASGTAKGGKITTVANETVGDLVNSINDLNSLAGTGGNAPLATPAISASLDSSGHLTFSAVNGGTLSVQFTSGSGATDTNSLGTASALGFANIAVVNTNGAAAANDIIGFTASADSTLNTGALYATTAGTTAIATADTLIKDIKTSTGTAANNVTNAADTLTLKVGGKTSGNILAYANGTFTATALTTTVQDVVDAINHDSTIGSLVSASFNATSGQIVLTPLTAAATDVQFQFGGATGESLSTAVGTGLAFGTQTLTTAAQLKAQEDVRFGAAAGTLASLQTQYNTTLSQITALTNDTGYAGTNLLGGDNLTTFFNATRTSSLVTSGTTFTASGLGLTTANFQNSAAITSSITQTQAALTSVRNFGSTLANNLSIIQNRQTFLTSQINTLQTGSDALTNADQNQEGADLLALQTRQSLGITSLSLASQAQQAILKLF